MLLYQISLAAERVIRAADELTAVLDQWGSADHPVGLRRYPPAVRLWTHELYLNAVVEAALNRN